jgi:sodium/potassium/calcium exchanger 4
MVLPSTATTTTTAAVTAATANRARRPGGAQAISNAFGSNTFNIFVGLGLPWAAYVATAGGGSYHALPDEGIVDSVAILIGTLVFFVGLLFANDFVLYPRHGYLFIAMYAAYLVYAVGKVYLVD